MTMIDWQSAIEANLEDESRPQKRKVHYKLPRQMGTTTFLVGLANRMAEDGKKVIFMVPSQRHVKEYQKRVEDGVVVVSGTNIWNLKGWHYDYLLGDCLGDKMIEEVERETFYIKATRLYIDSVD